MNKKSGLSGQCLCGGVRFQAASAEPKSGICHCRMCQRWAGGPFVAVTASDVTFDGEENLEVFRSSDWAERAHCRKCGSNVYYKALKLESYEFAIGVIDEPGAHPVTGEIFIDRKPDAYAFAGDHPRLTEEETIEQYRDYTGS